MQGIYIYGIVFLISILGARMIEKENGIAKYKIIYLLLLLVVIIPPCLLAGIRADTVGVDTHNYILQYEYASSHKDYPTIYALFGAGTEVVIAFLVYNLSLLNVSTVGYLFILQFLTMIPVILIARQLKDKVPFSWVIACYLFLFYNNSLNLARQSLSVAWLTLMAVTLILNKNKLKGKTFAIIIPGIIGMLFHKAGIVGLVLILFCCFISNRNMSRMKKALLYMALVIAIVFSGQILNLLMDLGIINRGLTWYGDLFITHKIYRDYFINPFGKYGIPDVVIRLLLIVLPTFTLTPYIKKDGFYKSLKSIVSMGFAIFTVVLFALRTNYGQRISMYLDWTLIVLIPYGIKNSKIYPRKPYLYVILVTYWLVWIFAFGWSASGNYVMNPNL